MAEAQDACCLCETVVNDEDIPLQEQFRLTIDIKATLVNKPLVKEDKKTRKTAREDKTEELTKKVSALRNAGGGALLIHLLGLSPNDRCLALFNEYVDDTLTKLIEDGVLFVDTYSKIWLSEHTTSEKYQEYLVLIVKSSLSLTTADFKTKVTSDENLTRPTTLNIKKLLFNEQQQKEKRPKIRGIDDSIQEGRDIEFKSFHKTPFEGIITQTNVKEVLEYIWKDLRLREYISSFTKIQDGGSYYLGIGEGLEEITGYNYKTKNKILSGIRVEPSLHETVKKGLTELIRQHTIVQIGNAAQPRSADSLVKFKFHEVDKDQVYILEVAVGYTPGCVFYDTPEVYTMIEGSTQMIPVEFSEWLEKVKTFHPARQSK
ncbi:uncharacterized protein [Haliotis asinina]|uniref:uncharacterized protein n=1 Tax=Haliotis asinina TaxID=109174 RepID=UPI0035321F1F